MKRSRLVAVVVLPLLLALAVPAGARERCAPVEPAPEEANGATDGASSAWVHEADSRWVHDVDSRWVHEDADRSWVHEGADPGWVHADAGGAWVHETDYGWWAAVPTALSEPPPGAPAAGEDEDEICWDDDRRNECVALANQIAVYSFRLELALDREDELWEASLRDLIQRLEARGVARSCPWVEPSLREQIEQTIAVVAEALGVAAQVALRLYTLGLL